MAKRDTTAVDLHRALEALLFLAGKPLTVKKIAEFLGADLPTARAGIDAFRETWNARNGGTWVVAAGDTVQLCTHPDLASILESYAKEEFQSELTRPQLEALTVIAYRGPITKAELEQIRGVNCALILRNLFVRGLIASHRDAKRHEDVYTMTVEFLRHLGYSDARELPEYDRFHGDAIITQYLVQTQERQEQAQGRARTGGGAESGGMF